MNIKNTPNTYFPLIGKLAKKFDKSIFIFDLETTGLAVATAGIVEIAFLSINPDGTYNSLDTRVNPEMEIPYFSTKVHKIKNIDVDHLDNFSSLISSLKPLLSSCVVSGYNSKSYDVNVLKNNFIRYGSAPINPDDQLDVRDIWKTHSKSSKGTLVDVASHYKVIPGISHKARGDVITTVKILEAMLLKHGEDFIVEHLTTIPQTQGMGDRLC